MYWLLFRLCWLYWLVVQAGCTGCCSGCTGRLFRLYWLCCCAVVPRVVVVIVVIVVVAQFLALLWLPAIALSWPLQRVWQPSTEGLRRSPYIRPHLGGNLDPIDPSKPTIKLIQLDVFCSHSWHKPFFSFESWKWEQAQPAIAICKHWTKHSHH